VNNHQTLTEEAAQAVTTGLSSGYPKLDEQRLSGMTKWLAEYSTTTLEKIIASADNPDRYWGVESAVLTSDPKGERFLSDFLHLAGDFEEMGENYLDAAEPFLHALDFYDGITPHGAKYEYPESRLSQCRAIITVTFHMEKLVKNWTLDDDAFLDYEFTRSYEGSIPVVADLKLRALLTGADHAPERVAALIIERNIVDPDELIELLRSSPAPAIAEGVL
jgi:hypothetical protein